MVKAVSVCVWNRKEFENQIRGLDNGKTIQRFVNKRWVFQSVQHMSTLGQIGLGHGWFTDWFSNELQLKLLSWIVI